MTTVFIDLIIGFWLLIFGTMALLPILTGTTSTHQRHAQPEEDRVISIAPVRPSAATPSGRRTPLVPRDDHHDRPAA
jgi:hypothetical protein